MKYALDFDGTLTNPRMQAYARLLVTQGNDVWIVTAREWNKEIGDPYVELIAEKCYIPKLKIISTGEEPKWTFIIKMGFDIFIDNSKAEVAEVARHTSALALWFDEGA